MEPLLKSAVAIAIIAAGFYCWYWSAKRTIRRSSFIDDYHWPNGLLDKLSEHYPDLTAKQHHEIGEALRQFFKAYLSGGQNPVAMPSKAVDALWHEFILFTVDYQNFCKKAFGKFMHHHPAKVITKKISPDSVATVRVWTQCCKIEDLDPLKPARLPTLFGIDNKLRIPGGYRYKKKELQNLAEATSAGGSGGGGCAAGCGGS